MTNGMLSERADRAASPMVAPVLTVSAPRRTVETVRTTMAGREAEFLDAGPDGAADQPSEYRCRREREGHPPSRDRRVSGTAIPDRHGPDEANRNEARDQWRRVRSLPCTGPRGSCSPDP